MKYLFLTLFSLSFSCSIGHAQSINQYKYIQVPEKFTDFKEDQYQLNYYLKLLLRKNNYTVLNENVNTWPEEARKDPCLALRADVLKFQKLLKTGLELKFYDCKNAEIASFEGVSRIKEYEQGYQEALGFAVDAAGEFEGAIEPVNNSSILTKNTVKEKNIPTENGILFENGNQKIRLTELKNGDFLIYQEPEHVVMAQMNPSSRAGVFRVTVIGQKEKYTTVGYYEGENLTIDFIENGKAQTIEFKKLNQ